MNPSPARKPRKAAHPNSFTAKALAEVATRLWRARRHAQRLAGDTDPALQGTGVRPLLRELDAALAGLTDAGVVVQDHDGDLFDAGLTLLAVAFQPTPGLTCEQALGRCALDLSRLLHLQRGGSPGRAPTIELKESPGH
jgi:hypothetical protein